MFMTEKVSTNWYLEPKVNETWAYTEKCFSRDECSKIIDKVLEKEELFEAHTGDKNSGALFDEDVRKSKIVWLNSEDMDYTWIYQRLTDAVVSVNKQFWNFSLEYIENIQFTAYDDTDAHYAPHIDMMHTGFNNRKLSVSIQLSDPESYEGCDVKIFDGLNLSETVRTQGSAITFPSYMLHQVSPLKKGVRYALVAWICGPRFV